MAADSPAGRFIPACVGNSNVSRALRRSRTVHPRVCGELVVTTGLTNGSTGSSPRVGGTLPSGSLPLGLRRFIPACVGNSTLPAWCCVASPVHPRVCGELRAGMKKMIRGSRFIPACVGNSIISRARVSTMPVHPRVCGELDIKGIRKVISTGSSPRVWGTHPGPPPLGIGSRFIPACVGNSIM